MGNSRSQQIPEGSATNRRREYLVQRSCHGRASVDVKSRVRNPVPPTHIGCLVFASCSRKTVMIWSSLNRLVFRSSCFSPSLQLSPVDTVAVKARRIGSIFDRRRPVKGSVDHYLSFELFLSTR
jgi:hypothetical protein